jgi:hypothetical protein
LEKVVLARPAKLAEVIKLVKRHIYPIFVAHAHDYAVSRNLHANASKKEKEKKNSKQFEPRVNSAVKMQPTV